MLASYGEWQKEVGDPFADPANIKFWLEEQEMGLKTNDKGKKGSAGGGLERFLGKTGE